MAFSEPNRKKAPEHRRLSRYGTMPLDEIMELPVAQVVQGRAHLYLWVPNALILEGLEVMRRWGFTYKTNLVWYKTRKGMAAVGKRISFVPTVQAAAEVALTNRQFRSGAGTRP
jgi:N6-adenosine-specific RNA methylase IME4